MGRVHSHTDGVSATALRTQSGAACWTRAPTTPHGTDTGCPQLLLQAILLGLGLVVSAPKPLAHQSGPCESLVHGV